ncbi:hypothetical protein B0J17DRAFT_633786 [Rhizoctonia solani]|nr:hypothetical protein B0J17DRAFT_633786 [Rhizoctonia solani]
MASAPLPAPVVNPYLHFAMDSTISTRKILLACQYWATMLRLLDALYVFGIMEYQLSQTYPNAQIELDPVSMLSSQLGCIATQLVISIVTVVLSCMGGCWNIYAMVSWNDMDSVLALGLYLGQFGWEPMVYGGSPSSNGKAFLQWISPVFLRRVSPVKTKGYAFIWNSFAASAICVILFQTVTALLKAQNKIETWMKSRDCSEQGYQPMLHDIQVLTEYDSVVANTMVYSVDVLNVQLEPCAPVLPQLTGSAWIQQIFSCNIPSSQVPVFQIKICSPSRLVLTEASMPYTWLSNKVKD